MLSILTKVGEEIAGDEKLEVLFTTCIMRGSLGRISDSSVLRHMQYRINPAGYLASGKILLGMLVYHAR